MVCKVKRLKTYRLFESVDTDELLSIVKDMLKELDFNDFSHNAVIRRQDGREFIRVAVYKPAIVNRHTIANSFTWNHVKGVMNPIIDFLSEEGFEWFKDKGTSSSRIDKRQTERLLGAGTDRYYTRVEMWFLRI